MATFLDRSWVTQPNTYSRFNENSGLANGLVALITVRNGIPFELISGRAFSPTGNASNRYSNLNGFPINFATTSSGTDSWNISDLPALNTTSSALTLFAFSYSTVSNTTTKRIINFSGAGGTVMGIRFGTSAVNCVETLVQVPGGIFPAVQSSATPAANQSYFLSASRWTGTLAYDLFINGVLDNGTTLYANSSALATTATSISLGNAGGTQVLNGGVLIAGFYKIGFDQRQHKVLQQNYFDLFSPYKSPIIYSFSSISSSDVNVSLTGQSSTFNYGTFVPALSRSLSGLSASFSRGTLTPALAKTLTGQSATFSGGTLTPVTGITVTLTGQSFTGSVGSLKAALAVNLLGQSVTTSGGTITPSVGGNVSVNLSGISGTFSYGTLTAGLGLPPETMEFSWSNKKAKFSFKARYMNFDID